MQNSNSLIKINNKISELEKEKLELQRKKDPLSVKKTKNKIEKIDKELENLNKEKEKLNSTGKDNERVKFDDSGNSLTRESMVKKFRESNKDNLIEIDGRFYRKSAIKSFDGKKDAIKKINGKDYFISYEYNLQTHGYDEYYILLDSDHIKYTISFENSIWCTPKDEHDFYKAKINGKIYCKDELVNIDRHSGREYRPKNDSITKKIIRKNNAKKTVEKIVIFLFYCSVPTIIIGTLLGFILGIDEIALLGWGLGLGAGILAIIISALFLRDNKY